jgi:hypothetical protein
LLSFLVAGRGATLNISKGNTVTNTALRTTAPARRRRVTQAARVIVATGAVAAWLGVAASATAEPSSTDTAPYNACVKNAKANGSTTVAARFDCCLIVGWNWVGGTYPAGWCVSPAFDTKSTPPPPPPGATVILPPGGQTRQAQ